MCPIFRSFSIKEISLFRPVFLGVPFLYSLISVDSNVYLSNPASYYPNQCCSVIWLQNKVHWYVWVVLFIWYTNSLLHPLLVLCLSPSSIFLGSPHYHFFNFCSYGQWSWCSDVYFTSVQFHHLHPGSSTSFHIYIISFVPHKLDTNFTNQICKRWGTFVVVCSNTFQFTRPKMLMCNIPLSYSKVSSSLLLIFFLIISPNKSVILVTSILQPVGSWGRPGVIGALFLNFSGILI